MPLSAAPLVGGVYSAPSPDWAQPQQTEGNVKVDRRARILESYLVGQSFWTNATPIIFNDATDPATLGNPTATEMIRLRDSFVNLITFHFSVTSPGNNIQSLAVRLQVQQDNWSTADPVIFFNHFVGAGVSNDITVISKIPVSCPIYAFAVYINNAGSQADINVIFS